MMIVINNNNNFELFETLEGNIVLTIIREHYNELKDKGLFNNNRKYAGTFGYLSIYDLPKIDALYDFETLSEEFVFMTSIRIHNNDISEKYIERRFVLHFKTKDKEYVVKIGDDIEIKRILNLDIPEDYMLYDLLYKNLSTYADLFYNLLENDDLT